MTAYPQDLIDEIRELKRRLHAVEGRANIRPAMDQVINGDVVIGEGGTLRVDDEDGSQLMYIGGITPAHPDGSPQRGIILYREDGTRVFDVWTAGSEPQAVHLYDSQEHLIFADDAVSGEGLARPYLPYPSPTEDDVAKWPSTSNTAWTTIARSRAITQHPRLHITADIGIGNATGQIRLLCDGISVAEGQEGSPINETVSMPNYTFGADVEFQLQARRTSGTGYVSGTTRYIYGVQS